MDYQEALSYIHSHKRFGSHPTLDRMRRLMDLAGEPQKKLRFVHIAGTNGKGSTAAMTASVLQAAGHRVGLTVSPYILDFRERMQVDGRMIQRDMLARITAEIRPLADQVEELTEFELVTAIAYLWFAQEGCDIVIQETGLGGRFDATNVIDAPLAAAVTQIGLDHTAVLGDTLEEIAHEKCGILKPGCPLAVTCSGQGVEALSVIMEHCMQCGIPLVQPNRNAVSRLVLSLEGAAFQYQGMQLHIPLAGRHQVDNAMTAVEICRNLGGGFTCGEEAVAKGLAGAAFPARLEVLSKEPLTLVDGAHNPDGAHALALALKLAGDRPLIGILGMLGDKDSAGALAHLAPCFARVYCVTPDNPRALPARELAEQARQWCADTQACESIQEACQKALHDAQEQGGAVVACGSLYLAAEARRILKQA